MESMDSAELKDSKGTADGQELLNNLLGAGDGEKTVSTQPVVSQELLKKRALRNSDQRRWRKKSNLRLDVADFQQRLQARYGVLDINVVSEVNIQLRKITNLPRLFNDQDLARARGALNALERKYFGRTGGNLHTNEAEALTVMLNTLEESKLSNLQKVNVALELLTSVGRDLFISAGDGLNPSPDAALLLLTQDMNGTMPKWLPESLADLLEQHFNRADVSNFLKKLEQILQGRYNEKYKKQEEKNREDKAQQEMLQSVDGIDIVNQMAMVLK